MSTSPKIWRDPNVRNYLFIAAAALLITFFIMMTRNAQIGAFLAVVVAIPGLIGRWAISPILYLLVIGYFAVDPNAMLIVAPEYFGRPRARTLGSVGQWSNAFGILDLSLILVVMVYLMAQYRLFSLMRQSFPRERLPYHRRHFREQADRRRPAHNIRDEEFTYAFAVLAGCLLAAQLGWLLIWELAGRDNPNSVLAGSVGVFVMTVWAISVGLLISASLSGYLHMRNATRDEAEAFLRDGMWQELNREQSRIARWSRWYRQRNGEDG